MQKYKKKTTYRPSPPFFFRSLPPSILATTSFAGTLDLRKQLKEGFPKTVHKVGGG